MLANPGRFSTIVVLLFSIAISAYGQFTVTRVTETGVNTDQDGFFYALPQTVFKVDLLVEKIQKRRGPLADYAEDYLGTTAIIPTNSSSYRILDVKIESEYEADPSQLYYVQFPTEKSKDEESLTFSLTHLGTILAFDDEDIKAEKTTREVDQNIFFIEGDDDFHYYPDYNRKKKVDTITRKITIDTVSIERFIFKTSWVDKSTKDRAEEAARQIAGLREARFQLLTGYQEVNYGESMKYMDYQLQKMEQQYLELFVGKETKSHVLQTIYYIPEKAKTSDILLTLDNGQEVEIKVSPAGNMGSIPQNALSKADNIYYRVPDMAEVEISYDGEVMFRKRMPVNQLGVVALAPLSRSKTQFDPNTGTLIKIKR